MYMTGRIIFAIVSKMDDWVPLLVKLSNILRVIPASASSTLGGVTFLCSIATLFSENILMLLLSSLLVFDVCKFMEIFVFAGIFTCSKPLRSILKSALSQLQFWFLLHLMQNLILYKILEKIRLTRLSRLWVILFKKIEIYKAVYLISVCFSILIDNHLASADDSSELRTVS